MACSNMIDSPMELNPPLDRRSTVDAKIQLFRSLFRGRDDVYARRVDMSERKLTAAEKAEKRRRKQEYQTIFIRGKMKRVRRPPTIEGMSVEEFIRRNADPIWLHQNEMWEYLEGPPQIDELLDAPMKEMTKAQKRHLRELSAIAHDRELGVALKDLHGHFARWQAGKITAGDLNELIHAHHNGIARELYNVYSGGNLQASVARALAKDVIRWDEVKGNCRALLADMVKHFGDERF